MSYEASTMNNHNFPFADGTASYTRVVLPTSSPSPAYNNPNGTGGAAGENNYTSPVTAGINVSGSDVVKRKRGRPRKYSPDGPIPPPATMTSTTLHGPPAAESGDFSSPLPSSGKKPRGRPPGSTNKQQPAASGSPGAGFMPHILDVKSGEDVLAKLGLFFQNSTRTLCILSASGSISNVTLQQTATSGGTVTYEGRFEILSLSGSFMVSENGGERSRTGGLSVALSGPEGRVLGGNVAGLLTAASPVQVIVGSFIPASQKQSKAKDTNEAEVLNGSANPVSGASAGGSLSESSGGGFGSQSNNSNPQGMAAMPWR